MKKYNILLNEAEKNIFKFLKKFIIKKKLDVTLRVAGGWVRDKLIGNNSDDIDIALDNYMGIDFVMKIKDYWKENEKENINFSLLKSNPKKTKKLETATILLFNHEIDFVNLRKEIYDKKSRIPEISVGTPEEDAFRRDFTINSLFYNINDELIEDFTNKGLIDIENKVLRTPISAEKSFIDDPLRIIRGFRFLSKLNYNFDENIVKILKSKEAKDLWLKKVSKERIGAEFSKSLKMNYNYLFFEKLKEYDYHFILLSEELLNFENNKSVLNSNIDRVIDLLKNNKIITKYINVNEKLEIIILSLLLFKLKNISIKNNVVKSLVYDNLKLTNKIKEGVERVINSVNSLLLFNSNDIKDQTEIIKFLVLWVRNIKDLWEISFIISENQFVYDLILKYNLEYFYLVKPLLNGKDIKKEFNVEKTEIKKISEEVLIYQVNNKESNKEDFIGYYKSIINN